MLISYLTELFRSGGVKIPVDQKKALFRLCTSYLFHCNTHRHFVGKVRDWVAANDYCEAGETDAHRAKEILAVIGRHRGGDPDDANLSAEALCRGSRRGASG